MPTMRQLKAQQQEIERFKHRHDQPDRVQQLLDQLRVTDDPKEARRLSAELERLTGPQAPVDAIADISRQLADKGGSPYVHVVGQQRARRLGVDDAASGLDAALAAIHAGCKHVTVGLSQTQVDALKAVAATPGASGGWHNQLDQAIKLYTDMRLENMPFDEWQDYDIKPADRCHHPGTTDD